jgi:photosystem II stability/assembly factor-like uncharacterized protein
MSRADRLPHGAAPNGVVLLATSQRGVEAASTERGGSWACDATLTGVRASCLAVHAGVPGLVYAGTRDRGVWRSEDRGASWRPVGLTGCDVTSLAVSRADPSLVYAGCKPASLFVSRDGGGTWRELDGFQRVRRWYWLSPAEPPDVRAYVMGLSASPTDPDVVVAGIEAGAVVRSCDGGRSWSAHRRAADRDCHDLTFHASDGHWVYEAGGGGPAVSRDAGERWEHSVRGMAGRYAMAVAADPLRPEVWYVSAAPIWSPRAPLKMPVGHTEGGAMATLYRSSGGAGWEPLRGGLPMPLDHPPYGLATAPEAPGHVYLGLSHGEVWHSADHGDTWSRLPFRFSGVRRALAIA